MVACITNAYACVTARDSMACLKSAFLGISVVMFKVAQLVEHLSFNVSLHERHGFIILPWSPFFSRFFSDIALSCGFKSRPGHFFSFFYF